MNFDITQVVLIMGLLANLVAIIRFLVENRKEKDAQLIWRTETTMEIKELNKRVDSHNNYAKMFADCTKDIAYIKGKIEDLERND